MSLLEIQYLGHATTQIRLGDKTFLTDPVFSRRVLCFGRRRELPFRPEELPHCDGILLSHLHHDHLDLHSYKFISSKIPIFVPEGSAKAVERFVNNPIIELSRWATYPLDDTTTLYTVPMKHCGGRWPYGLCYRNTFGYILEKKGGPTVFFAGDSAYGPQFKDSGKNRTIDCALLPVGGYEPRWLFRRVHMNPQEAVQAANDLQAKIMIPIHWGVFRFSLESTEKPKEELQRIQLQQPEWRDRIKILEPGESFSL